MSGRPTRTKALGCLTRPGAPRTLVPLPSLLPLQNKECTMGKYFIAWLLGVPAVLLVIAYFIFGG
ncbi:MAG: hypothetical protein HY856_18485 [Burkholderiales bacterium]|nr:hypothetical protein [Burkholderiales bacterium]